LQSLSSVLRRVSLFRGRADATAVSDAELLRRFQASGDEAAFELLVWRHGPMVLGICRRILRDAHAAEDAFQATFLTLACKAASISTVESVAGWLYTVARRVALAARARQERVAAYERTPGPVELEGPGYLPPDEPAERELRDLVRAEVDRLPDPFRSVVVLCCLEGRTHAEAAEQLGVPTGTVESRLVRARDRLRLGLAARGVAMAVGPLAAFLADHATDLIKVSPVLVHGTVHLVLLMKMGALASAGAAAEVAEEAGRASARVFRFTVAAAVVAVATLGSSAAVILPPPAPAVSPAPRGGAVPRPSLGPLLGPAASTPATSFPPPRQCHPIR
jgi:RNA polymerase sigma factor (sigma-70 family)